VVSRTSPDALEKKILSFPLPGIKRQFPTRPDRNSIFSRDIFLYFAKVPAHCFLTIPTSSVLTLYVTALASVVEEQTVLDWPQGENKVATPRQPTVHKYFSARPLQNHVTVCCILMANISYRRLLFFFLHFSSILRREAFRNSVYTDVPSATQDHFIPRRSSYNSIH
jgi:hypothetical protein